MTCPIVYTIPSKSICNHKMRWIQPLRCRSMTAGKRKRAAFQTSGSEYGRCALLLALIWNAKGLRVFLQPWDGTFTFRQKLSKIYPRTENRYSVRCLEATNNLKTYLHTSNRSFTLIVRSDHAYLIFLIEQNEIKKKTVKKGRGDRKSVKNSSRVFRFLRPFFKYIKWRR